MKKILIVVLSVFILSSCTTKGDTNKEDASINAIESSDSIQQEDYDAIFAPNQDSLSVDQKELQHKLLVLMKEHVKIKNGLIYSSATKEDFESQGIAVYYFNLLEKKLGDLNTAIKKDGLDAQKLFEEMMKDYPEI